MIGMMSITAGELRGQEGENSAPPGKELQSPTIPLDRLDLQFWEKRHGRIVERVKKGDVGMIMIGDSIVHEFKGVPWETYYEPRRALNLGFWGDKTQNVLWRLHHGEIDGISPKVAVVMIGTNNTSRGNTPVEVFEGVKAICETLRAKLPETKILLIAIIPRGKAIDDERRLANEEANRKIAKLADEEHVFFLDINDKFLTEDGMVRKDLLKDWLHPSPEGYAVWAKAMEPTLAKLMGDEVRGEPAPHDQQDSLLAD